MMSLLKGFIAVQPVQRCISKPLSGLSRSMSYFHCGYSSIWCINSRNHSRNILFVKEHILPLVSFAKPFTTHSEEGEPKSTKIEKDALLFKYDNPRYYRYLSIFGTVMFIYWSYTGLEVLGQSFESQTSREENSEDSVSSSATLGSITYFGSSTVQRIVGTAAMFMGWLFLAGSYMYSIRSVRYLVLRKGGKSATFITYRPLGGNITQTFNVNDISCSVNRKDVDVIPLKVRGKAMHYLLYRKEGEFYNLWLFDKTVGLQRRFK